MDTVREELGVESVCRELQIAPTYYAAKKAEGEPSQQALQHEE
ncbi:hypothetical protein AB0I94_34330 [Streptomyces sp. NPDC050147]